MGVGENIKALRKKSSLTQEEFAKLIGVSKETVCRWEKGRSAIRQSTLQTITSMFNLQPDDLTSEAAGLAAQNEFPKKSRPEKNCQPSEMCDAFKIAMSSGRTGLKRTGTVPSSPSLLARHPNCFFVQMDTSAMSKCYPIGSLLLVDPNKKPWNGCTVLAIADNSRMVIRRYSVGTSSIMLSSHSYRTAEPDIVLDKRRIRILGVIVWFQASHDLGE